MIVFFGRRRGRRRFSLMVILLVAAVLAWWLSWGGEDLLYRPQTLLSHEPDYFLEDFTLVVSDEDGAPRYQLSASSMTHYADDNTALLKQPRMEIIGAKGGRWIIVAKQARAEQNGDIVRLVGAVSIYRDGDAVTIQALQTEALDVYVAEGYAVTDHEVVITQAFGITRGKGLRIDFRQRQLSLKSRVRGEYVLPAG